MARRAKEFPKEKTNLTLDLEIKSAAMELASRRDDSELSPLVEDLLEKEIIAYFGSDWRNVPLVREVISSAKHAVKQRKAASAKKRK